MMLLPKLFSTKELNSFRDNMVNELKLSMELPKKQSLNVTQINQRNILKDSDFLQLMIIGGSNFWQATGVLNKSSLEIREKPRINLPNFNKKDDLGKFFLEHLDPDCSLVVISFAYPMIPEFRGEFLDGKLLKGAKESKLLDLEGCLIGEFLEQYVLKQRKQKLRIVLVNDIVSLLLSSRLDLKSYCTGLIIGTGFNAGMWTGKSDIINFEIGHFADFELSKSGQYVDEKSWNRGFQKLEKEVSGAYLWQHYNYYANLNRLRPITNSYKLSSLARGRVNTSCEIARLLLMRSSSLVAVLVAALYDYKKSEMDLIIDGSLFWEGYNYVGYFVDNLRKLKVDLSQIKILKYDDPFFSLSKLVTTI
jgi:hypothetical protein